MPSITPQNRDFLETVAVGVVLTAITTGTLLLVGWLDLGRSLILASLFVAIMAGTAAYKAYHLGRRRPSETFILIVSILISLSMVVAQLGSSNLQSAIICAIILPWRPMPVGTGVSDSLVRTIEFRTAIPGVRGGLDA